MGVLPRGIYYQNRLLVCDCTAKCLWLPVGHLEWIPVPGFTTVERKYMAMTVVLGLVMVSGGVHIGAGQSI